MFNSCGACADQIPQRYDIDYCDVETRKAGKDRLIGFHCSLEFVDMLDMTEWETHIAAGLIMVTPIGGDFEESDGTADTWEDGCGNDYTDFVEVPWVFRTGAVAKDWSDEVFFDKLHRQFNHYTWAPIDCNGRITLNNKVAEEIKAALLAGATAVPATYPGLKMSITSIPAFKIMNGKGKAGKWEFNGNYQHKYVLQTVDIPDLMTTLSENA